MVVLALAAVAPPLAPMRAQITKADYAQPVQYAQVKPQLQQQWQIAAPVNAYMMNPMISPMAQQMQD